MSYKFWHILVTKLVTNFDLKMCSTWAPRQKGPFTCLESRVARFLLVQTYQSWKNITIDDKLYQSAINCTKWPKNIPNTHIKLPHFPFQGPPNLTQIGIFGVKINYLATLAWTLLSLTVLVPADLFLTGIVASVNSTCSERWQSSMRTAWIRLFHLGWIKRLFCITRMLYLF
jgi:hypothetical protein